MVTLLEPRSQASAKTPMRLLLDIVTELGTVIVLPLRKYKLFSIPATLLPSIITSPFVA